MAWHLDDGRGEVSDQGYAEYDEPTKATETPMTEAVGHLDKALALNNEVIEKLRERLRPVLRPQNTAPGPVEGALTAVPSSAPLVDATEEFARTVEDRTEQIMGLLNRLEV